MRAALLPDRGVVTVRGEDAGHFLNGLLTNDIGQVTPGSACFAALLTPQGKIIVDVIVVADADADGYVLDVPRALTKTLVDRLNFYRLRARVTIEDRSVERGVLAVWAGEAASACGLCYADPRLPALGRRIVLPPHLAARAVGGELASAEDYEAHRIALGVPRGGLDFTYGDAFPHETDMDQLHGVDFHKGCYVGQEVVSRMQHRGHVRTRIVPVSHDGFAPDAGAAVMAGDKQVGTFGSSARGHALAMLRLDRVEDALAAGHALVAGGITLHLVKCDWIGFAVPGETERA